MVGNRPEALCRRFEADRAIVDILRLNFLKLEEEVGVPARSLVGLGANDLDGLFR